MTQRAAFDPSARGHFAAQKDDFGILYILCKKSFPESPGYGKLT